MPTFFKTPAHFRTWLEKNAATETELIVGFYKRDSGRPSLTWPESVDEALCFGWIDGVRKRIDDASYQIRFTPRKPTSSWSAINIEKVRILKQQGRMTEAGLKAFSHRRTAKSRTYSYEQRHKVALSPQEEAEFRHHEAAWKFFEAQPPSYRRLVIWYTVSAMKPETRKRRFANLINACEKGVRL